MCLVFKSWLKSLDLAKLAKYLGWLRLVVSLKPSAQLQLTQLTQAGLVTRLWNANSGHGPQSKKDIEQNQNKTQGDHSPDNVQFPDGSQHSFASLSMLSVTHIMPILVLNTCMDTNIQLTINSLGHFSLTRFPPRHFPDF